MDFSEYNELISKNGISGKAKSSFDVTLDRTAGQSNFFGFSLRLRTLY